MNTLFQFDKILIDFVINQLPHSKTIYEIMFFLSGNNLLKGGVLILIIVYLWFKNFDSLSTKKIAIIATLLASFTAIFISRILILVLPFRLRPLLNSEFVYFNFETNDTSINVLSAFPSDHAILFISLATGLFFVSRKAGLFALLYSSIFILFPRIYLGYHYPSDIIAGALIGSLISIIFNKSRFILAYISDKIMPLSKKYTRWFYPLFFLISLEIVNLFGDFRALITFLSRLI